MTNTIKGYQILLGIFGFIAIINALAPWIKSIENSQGQLSALLLVGIILYLLFKDYKFR